MTSNQPRSPPSALETRIREPRELIGGRVKEVLIAGEYSFPLFEHQLRILLAAEIAVNIGERNILAGIGRRRIADHDFQLRSRVVPALRRTKNFTENAVSVVVIGVALEHFYISTSRAGIIPRAKIEFTQQSDGF